MRSTSQAPGGGEVSRSTVDLTAFPDLVVIYLGMRVRTPRGLGTLRSLADRACSRGPTRRAPPARDAVVLPAPSPRRYAPVLARLRRARAGPARSRTNNGGAGSCATPAGRASGTRPTSCAAASTRSTTASPNRSGYSRSRRLGRRARRSSPPGGEPISKARKNSRQWSPMARRGEHCRSARAWPHNHAHSPQRRDRAIGGCRPVSERSCFYSG